MDTLAHALYGATLFSQTGLAGVFKKQVNGAVKHRAIDWTIYASAGFAILPDLASVGIYFLNLILNSQAPTFHYLPRYVFSLYNVTHSFFIAALACLILRKAWKPLFIPSLAWIFHIVLDIFTHGRGRFQTPFLWPLSEYAFDGLNWWQNHWVAATYWGVLPLLWMFIYFQHKRRLPLFK